MKKTFIHLLCMVLVIMLGLLPLLSVSADSRGYRYVKTSNGKTVNLRSDPWKADNVITRLPYRSYVLVYETSKDRTWSYVEAQNPNGSGTVKGWVQSSFLVSRDPGKYQPDDPDDPSETTTLADINRVAKAIKTLSESYYTVIKTKKAANYVHLRMFPDTNAVYTGAYLRDTEIEVLAESKTWAQVRIVEDGKVGFILKSCVTALEE